MKDNNKTNIVLLTIIGIATLLVAVVGATFAYFTAQIGGEIEEAPTIQVGAGELKIEYTDKTESSALSATDITPQPDDEEHPVITKTFTVTGTNTTNSTMPYTLALVVTQNTFRANSLKYTFEGQKPSGRGNDGVGSTIDYASAIGIDTTVESFVTTTEENGWSEVLTTKPSGIDPIVLCNNGACNFSGIAAGIEHSYTLKIYFPEKNSKQDYDKNRSFAGYIKVGVENATQLSS